jgi:hypothetical protein
MAYSATYLGFIGMTSLKAYSVHTFFQAVAFLGMNSQRVIDFYGQTLERLG